MKSLPSQILLYGFHAVTARVRQQPSSIKEIYFARDRRDVRAQALISLAETHKLPIFYVEQPRLDQLAGHGTHQGVVAKAEAAELLIDLDDVLAQHAQNALILVLDGIQDPHNLGACLRVADALGVHAVIAPKDRAVGLNATARKVASGAAETVPYITVTNLARTLRELKDAGLWITGTASDAGDDLFNAKLSGPLALVLGAEGAGLRRLTREHCDQLVRIPMLGVVASINVSVACGICLYEVQRQRSVMPKT